FISSASAYQTPPESWPITEETPLINPHWEYSRNKIACEELLHEAGREFGFPSTVVRPSHTYDKTLLPVEWGYTVIDRMKKGKKIIVHGDGSSLWTLTHHKDFAVALVGLLGRREAIGESYNITSDFWYSWDRIVRILADAAGVKADIVHVPSEVIDRYDAEIGASLLGDKTHSMIFDNRKIKALVPEFEAKIPFTEGAREIIDWYEQDVSRQIVDSEANSLMDRIIVEWEASAGRLG
ncbi:MAG: NAD-dependent epimerase/dehydratase family protein, partial [Spirochaetaceae bacterium]|nr:NAD-dependent epimerase/dehydratase family protein [Spirochaetaceae bacterium]